jgi:hypothetical protein
MSKKYRKKPVVIEAIQFDGSNYAECFTFIGSEIESSRNLKDQIIRIHTLEGTMIACKGDFIIRGVKGEFYPCKPDIFESTYEEVEGLESDESHTSKKPPCIRS